MKKTVNSQWKNVLSRLFISVVAFITIVVSSFAWFISNREADGSGMTAKVETFGNLIVAKTSAEITAIDSFSETHTSVSFKDDEVAATYPAKHDSACAVGTTGCNTDTYTYLLKITNPSKVDYSTGLEKKGETLAFTSVTTTEASSYYTDYVLYLASTDKSLTTSGIKATISIDNDNNTHKARTVDFYCDGKYAGKLNVAEAAAGTKITIFSGTVPYNKTGNIKVLMRTYFDGSATDSSGVAYINTSSVYKDKASLSVKFEAEE